MYDRLLNIGHCKNTCYDWSKDVPLKPAPFARRTLLTAITFGLALQGCLRLGYTADDDAVPAADGSPGLDATSDGFRADDGRFDAPPGDGPDASLPDQGTPKLDGPDQGLPKLDLGGVAPGTWVQLLAGSFNMGAPAADLCKGFNETLHPVTLTRSFWITTTEVSRAEFLAVMAYDPSTQTNCQQTSCPVDSVTWDEAAAYCNALSALEKRAACYSCSGSGTAVTCASATSYALGQIYDCPGYRLPTEAEWEYAYRANTTTELYNGAITSCMQADLNADAIAWYKGTAGGKPHPVGGKAPNAWQLYDMAGNLFEWCHDLYTNDLGSGAVIDPYGVATGSSHVLRSGCWGYATESVRAAYRVDSAKGGFIGLRCVRTVTP
jgi:formylglycine-generating enzyme required for sulfatase activity